LPDAAGAARLRAQATTADAAQGGSEPGPSVAGSGGCNDVDGGNVFLGDYMGLAVGSDGVAHPIWTDTRNPIFSPSTGGDVRELVPAGQGSDIYTRALSG
jgi:hypothetical protein